MESTVFEEFCAQARALTVGQIRQLDGILKSMGARIEVLARIDARCASIKACLHCGSDRLRRWGETRTGLQRLRCLACLRTFSSATRTAMERVRLPEAFHRVVADMFSAAPQSCRRLAQALGLDKMTVWRWRHRIIKAMVGVGATEFRGIVEADEKFFRESRKGSREWVNYKKNLANFPQPPRPRWRDYRRLGRLLPAGLSRWQMPVLTISDRAGGRRGDVLPNRAGQTLIYRLGRYIRQDSVLCSDGDPAYAAFAHAQAIPHYVLNATTGPRVIANAYHIQNINNLHARFEAFMQPFCGPATKNLPAYTAWFIARLVGDHKVATDGAWNRLLAA
jgi:transposase-like protein